MEEQNVSCFDNQRIFLIEKRISEKIEDYTEYSFTELQDCALKIFFDLAQEFDDQRDFFAICVLIPRILFQIKSNLFLINDDGQFEMVCNSQSSSLLPLERIFYKNDVTNGPSEIEGIFSIPIRGNRELLSNLQREYSRGILGIFEVHSTSSLTDHMKLFFEKYVNRIGFQLHNRLITEQNKEHLQFIKNLVNDIGHNVIVPNMYFKLFFKRLKGKIDRVKALSKGIATIADTTTPIAEDITEKDIPFLAKELNYVNESMESQFREIISHYEQTSLFLETLLRRSHFEEGRYVIVPRMVNFRKKIIRPQLERYLPRFKDRNISVDNQLSQIPDDEITVVADVGLLSQVFANLFSNAAKYTRQTHDDQGKPHRYVSVGMELLENYFGKEKDGIQFNVFSTGPQITKQDASKLFEEGFRGGNVEKEYGTGHGLQFIKEVIDLHEGVVGYEPMDQGNNFYFILPK